ncbi:unnamed protein product [Didymodactylos carnosus]|nr:unnamed protein product [Didymodactylos carnosus]CAF3564554.1 unnamed protein product [Didymodactylos carnosus]
MVQFNEVFWGDRGFEVLSTNLKNGVVAIEEFQRFLNESFQCESTYHKNISRISSQLIKVQNVGTFSPIWTAIRDLLEKIASAHSTTVSLYQDLIRDVHSYHDSYNKKLKVQIQKDTDIVKTSDLIQQLNQTLNNLNKAKDVYHTVTLDYERAKTELRRSGLNQNIGTTIGGGGNLNETNGGGQQQLGTSLSNTFGTLTSSNRQFERLEKKYRQTNLEYRSLIEKYNTIRNEFEKRFYDVSNKFQDYETEHIQTMLKHCQSYSDLLRYNNEHIKLAYTEFNDKLNIVTIQDLLETFVEQKKTGVERPDNIKILPSLTNSSQGTPTPDNTDNTYGMITFVNESNTNTNSTYNASLPSQNLTFTMKKSENNRPSSSSSMTNNNNNVAHIPTLSLNNPNHPLSHLQSSTTTLTTASEQFLGSNPFNPFDVKIKKPSFKGLWPTRKEKSKEKKVQKTAQKQNAPDTQRDENVPVTLHNLGELSEHNIGKIIGSSETLNPSPTTISNVVLPVPKGKCPTPEPYSREKLSPQAFDKRQVNCQSTIPFSTAYNNHQQQQSSESSTSSDDDDDDYPMAKIQFKINPAAKTATTEIGDESKISDAMKQVDKNIGHLATYSRATGRKVPDLSKSISVGQMRSPPPPPPHPTSTMSTSATTDNVVNLSHSNDVWQNQRSNSLSSSTNPQAPFLTNNHEKYVTTSYEEDAEVANSFPNSSTSNSPMTIKQASPPPPPFPTIPRPITRTRQPIQQPTISTAQQLSSVSSSSVDSTITNGRTTPFTQNASIGTSASLQFGTNNSISSTNDRISPLTIGSTDNIPIAIAYQETVHVVMNGDDQTKWKIRILGDMLVSFPAAILHLLATPSPHLSQLEFCLKNLTKVDNIIANPQLVSLNQTLSEQNAPVYSFNMTALSEVLKSLQIKNPNLPFFNFGVLKYEVKHTGPSSVPIQVSSQWTTTSDTIIVNVVYRFNSSAFPDNIRLINDFVIFHTFVNNANQLTDSLPMAEWSLAEHKILWKVPYTFDGSGTLVATLSTLSIDHNNQEKENNVNKNEHELPVTTSSPIHVQFLGENALFSSIDFEFACRGYRVSLLKKKICSGKYQSESRDSNNSRHPSVQIDHQIGLSSLVTQTSAAS